MHAVSPQTALKTLENVYKDCRPHSLCAPQCVQCIIIAIIVMEGGSANEIEICKTFLRIAVFSITFFHGSSRDG